MSGTLALILGIFACMMIYKKKKKPKMIMQDNKTPYKITNQKILYFIAFVLLFASHFLYNNGFWESHTVRILLERAAVLIIYGVVWALDGHFVKEFEMEIDKLNKSTNTQDSDGVRMEMMRDVKAEYGFESSQEASNYWRKAFGQMVAITIPYLFIIFLADPVLRNSTERNLGLVALAITLIYEIACWMMMMWY